VWTLSVAIRRGRPLGRLDTAVTNRDGGQYLPGASWGLLGTAEAAS
jgi:hypothetical protein